MSELNETHDPSLQSWIESANDPESDFPIQNLPFAVFTRAIGKEPFRVGVAIGDQIVDLSRLSFTGKAGKALETCADSSMNRLMALGVEYWSALRLALSRALRAGSESAATIRDALVPASDATFGLPAEIGDYTDFYTSVHHATSVGKLFRPDNPLLPNYKWVPIGYHGRSSSIGVSGQTFPRPRGQIKLPDQDEPIVAPSRRMDYEMEMGIFVGPGNQLGEPIALDDAEDHVFGLCLFNDWSARDIQAWEYQPLGPFLAKNFASTVSPWVVTLEALAPFRTAWTRPKDDPQPVEYLSSSGNRANGGFDIYLDVYLQSEKMREGGDKPAQISHSNFRHSYWSVAQMVAHHSVNGCNLRPGDLLGTGTQSGPEPEEAGSLLELTGGGKQPLTLPNGEQRTFLEDGDAVVMRGYCEKPGAARIGFGQVESTLAAANS